MAVPSFSSFPDLDFQEGPSIQKGALSTDVDHEGHRRRRKLTEKKRKHLRDNDEEVKESKSSRKQDQDTSSSDLWRKDHLREEAKERQSTEDFHDFLGAAHPLFFSDKKGDVLNVKFGGLHSGDIPKYDLIDRRKVLGLSNAFTVIHRGRNGAVVAVGPKRQLRDLSEISPRRIMRNLATKRWVKSHRDDYAEVDGFIRITSSRRRRDELSSRDITIIASDSEESFWSGSEDDSDDGLKPSTEAQHATLSRREMLRDLESILEKDPSSIDAWLSLLSHTLSTVSSNSKNADKVRSEISLSVLKRALSSHPQNSRSPLLHLKYLQAGEQLWTLSQLNEEWEQVLENSPVNLWPEWLDWRIRVAQDGIDGGIRDAQRALAALRHADEAEKLRVFWRTATAIRDAGYTERGNALFQAQAELIFHGPVDVVGAPFDEALDRLEAFWESEAARVGEPDAPGWAVWESSGKPEAQSRSDSMNSGNSTIADPYVRWATNELSSNRSRAISARTLDDTLDADPYRIVMFSDIKHLLIQLRSPEAQHLFRLIWLAYLGVHIPGLSLSSSNSSDDRWCMAHFSNAGFISALFPTNVDMSYITADAHSGVAIGRELQNTNTFGPVKEWGMGVVDPLDTLGRQNSPVYSRQDLDGVDASIVKEVLRQCRLPGIDVPWDALSLAITCAWDSKTAVKMSKSLLASAQGSLQHWAIHARLERLRGRMNDARKVYTTILPSVSADAGTSTLWWDWADLEWHSSSAEATLQVILRAASVSGSGAVVILRAKRRLDELVNHVPVEPWQERHAWVKLRALLELLTSSASAALSIIHIHLGAVNPGTQPHESLIVAALLMLYTHGTILGNPLPPGLLREWTERAIEIYPDNTVVLGLFLEAQKGQVVWGKVQDVLSDYGEGGLTKEKGLSRRLAEIWAASFRKEHWKMEEERLRTKLTTASQDERTRASGLLWSIYLEFEIRAGQLQRAKKLLYRAIRECPLVKNLYLFAFVQLRAVFTPRELNGLVETMAERGLRMRNELEQMLLQDSSSTRQLWTSDDIGEEDIETDADELRRLRPY